MFNFEDIFYTSQKELRGALVVGPANDLTIDDAFGLFWGDIQPSEPVEFERRMGSRPYDLLDNGLPPLELVSDKFVGVLREHGFNGWKTYPAVVRGKEGVELPGYHGFSVTGRCGRIDNSQSKMIKRPPIIPGKVTEMTTWIGLYFDPSTWDGSDIFAPQDTGYMFVTNKVKAAIEAAHFTNLEFQRITEFERLMLT